MESLSHCFRLTARPTCQHRIFSPSNITWLPSSGIAGYHSFNTTLQRSSLISRPNQQLGIRLFHDKTLSSYHGSALTLTLACSSPRLAQPYRCSGLPPHSTSIPTRTHATCALAAEGHLGSFPTTHNIDNTANTANTANMGDRDLLPDTFKAGHYDLKITNLDFKDWSYNGSVTYGTLPLP